MPTHLEDDPEFLLSEEGAKILTAMTASFTALIDQSIGLLSCVNKRDSPEAVLVHMHPDVAASQMLVAGQYLCRRNGGSIQEVFLMLDTMMTRVPIDGEGLEADELQQAFDEKLDQLKRDGLSGEVVEAMVMICAFGTGKVAIGIRAYTRADKTSAEGFEWLDPMIAWRTIDMGTLPDGPTLERAVLMARSKIDPFDESMLEPAKLRSFGIVVEHG